MRSGIVLFATILCCYTSLTRADDIISESEHDCKFDGCLVKCAYERHSWKKLGNAKKVSIQIFDSGIIRIVLNKSFNEIQTIIMGGKGFICSIENEKK